LGFSLLKKPGSIRLHTHDKEVFMPKVLLQLSGTLVAVVLGAMILVACGSSASSGTKTTSASPSSQPASVTIPAGQELFAPFILVVQPGTIVTWQNNDRIVHPIMSTSDHSTFLNPQTFSLVAAADQKVSLTFTKPGVYDYFDKTQATWDATDHRVKANKGVPNFPLAMEGVIWVQGPLRGLPSAATNVIPSGKDDFTTDFLTISQGGTVSWHNSDTDAHFVGLVAGWSAPINPVDIGDNKLKGTNEAPPQGETKTITYPTPGLYYYYCPTHADINRQWHRAQAHTDASEFPLPMEGFVLVVGS
jgi:plastocyanin